MNARFETHGITTELLLDVFDIPVSFHRCLVPVTGGITSALMLSQAIWITQALDPTAEGWFIRSQEEWAEDTGLSRWEQETARRALRRAGLLEERRFGMPARLWFRVCLKAVWCALQVKGIPPSMMARIRLDCLLSLLTGGSSPRLSSQYSDHQGYAKGADSAAQNGETRMRQSHIHVSPKAPNQFCRNRHHCFDKSAIVLINRTTKDLLQPQDASHTPSEVASRFGGGDLIYPEQLLPDERVAAALFLRDCHGEAQALLDELAGRLKVRGVRSSPLAYLRALVGRAVAGSFVPELGPRIAAQRLQRQEEARQRGARAAAEGRLAAEHASREFEAEVQARREAARREIGDMKRRLRADKST